MLSLRKQSSSPVLLGMRRYPRLEVCRRPNWISTQVVPNVWCSGYKCTQKVLSYSFNDFVSHPYSCADVLLTHNQATSRSRKTARANENADENGSDYCTPAIEDCLPPLSPNEALARAVSEVKLSMAGWADAHIFKLLVILVEPPPSLDLSVIEGLGDYLTQLLAQLVNLAENGTRTFAVPHPRFTLSLSYSLHQYIGI